MTESLLAAGREVAILHTRALALDFLGRHDEARAIALGLWDSGWRHPDLRELVPGLPALPSAD